MSAPTPAQDSAADASDAALADDPNCDDVEKKLLGRQSPLYKTAIKIAERGLTKPAGPAKSWKRDEGILPAVTVPWPTGAAAAAALLLAEQPSAAALAVFGAVESLTIWAPDRFYGAHSLCLASLTASQRDDAAHGIRTVDSLSIVSSPRSPRPAARDGNGHFMFERFWQRSR